ncbi:MAG TPA: M48 family peptidase [Chromatiales bacterium]|jgi:predicted Zn-dependent protease|nr:M48 family peptidase [Chromatiales bacterium]
MIKKPICHYLSTLILTLLFHGGVLADNSDLPDIGSTTSEALSPLREKALADEFRHYLLRSNQVIDDPLVSDYVHYIGTRLASNADQSHLGFTFMVIDDPSINAFAGPGGVIGIHTGLILAAKSESELAGVLGHEIAHVTQRHLQRALDAMNRLQIPTAAALLAAILIGSQSPELAQAAISTVSAASIQQRIDFTRDNEKEADRIGIGILSRAGFDPLGMPGFFQRLQEVHRYQAAEAPEFLRTHPVTEARIADAHNRAQSLPTVAKQDESRFLKIQARLQGLGLNARLAEQRFRATLNGEQTPAERSATRYGLAVALEQLGKTAEAQQLYRDLLAEKSDDIYYIQGLASSMVAAGQDDKAITVYQNGLDLFPLNRGLSLGHARALANSGQYTQARGQLMALLDHRSDDVQLLRLLSKISEKAGEFSDKHLYLSEYYRLIGEHGYAVEQLEEGLKRSNLPFYDRARLQSRLDKLREEEAEKEHE